MFFSELYHIGGIQRRIVIEHYDYLAVFGFDNDLMFLSECAKGDKGDENREDQLLHCKKLVVKNRLQYKNIMEQLHSFLLAELYQNSISGFGVQEAY